MDILTAALILCAILSASAAMYFSAESRGHKAFIEKQDEIIAIQREELREWQNKALFRNNLTPLGRETEPRKEKDPNQVNGTPRVAMRAHRQARAAGQEAAAITIYANEVKNPRIEETVERARQIKLEAEQRDAA